MEAGHFRCRQGRDVLDSLCSQASCHLRDCRALTIQVIDDEHATLPLGQPRHQDAPAILRQCIVEALSVVLLPVMSKPTHDDPTLMVELAHLYAGQDVGEAVGWVRSDAFIADHAQFNAKYPQGSVARSSSAKCSAFTRAHKRVRFEHQVHEMVRSDDGRIPKIIRSVVGRSHQLVED